VDATAAATGGGGGGLEKTAKGSGDKLPGRQFTRGQNFLNDKRRGIVLNTIQNATTTTPTVGFGANTKRKSGQLNLNDGSVMKSRMPCVMSAATAQPSGQSRTQPDVLGIARRCGEAGGWP